MRPLTKGLASFESQRIGGWLTEEKGAGGIYYQGFISSQQTLQRYDKTPTSKIYISWIRILKDRNIFFTPRGGRITARSYAPGLLLFLQCVCRSLTPDQAGFRSAKQILA